VEPTYTDPNRSLHKDVFFFWTGFGISLLEYMLFSSIYWWALYYDRQKWTSGLLAIPILCSAVVLAASVSLSMWKLHSIGHILLAVRKESQRLKTVLTRITEPSTAYQYPVLAP